MQRIAIDAGKIFCNARIKSHSDYASVVRTGSSEVHLKKTKNSLHRKAGQTVRVAGILNQPQQLTYKNPVIFFLVSNAVYTNIFLRITFVKVGLTCLTYILPKTSVDCIYCTYNLMPMNEI